MVLNLIIIALFIVFLIYGIIKGFIGQLFGFIGTVAAFIVAALLCGTVVNIVKANTAIDESLQSAISGVLPNIDQSVIAGYPAFLQAIFAPILDGSASAVDTVAATLTNLIMSIVAFLIIVALIKLVFIILASVLKNVIRKTFLGVIDKLLGAVLGLIKGLLFVSSVLFVVEIALVPTIPSVAEAVEQSAIAKFLMDFNIYGLIFKMIGFA